MEWTSWTLAMIGLYAIVGAALERLQMNWYQAGDERIDKDRAKPTWWHVHHFEIEKYGKLRHSTAVDRAKRYYEWAKTQRAQSWETVAMLYDENTGLMIAGTQPRGPYAEILLEKVNVERAPTWFAAVRSYIGVTRRITSVLRTTFSTVHGMAMAVWGYWSIDDETNPYKHKRNDPRLPGCCETLKALGIPWDGNAVTSQPNPASGNLGQPKPKGQPKNQRSTDLQRIHPRDRVDIAEGLASVDVTQAEPQPTILVAVRSTKTRG